MYGPLWPFSHDTLINNVAFFMTCLFVCGLCGLILTIAFEKMNK